MSEVQVALDLYPGVASLPGSRTMRPVRAVVGNDRLQVVRNGGGVAVVEFEADVTSMTGSAAKGWTLETDLGEVKLESTGGCKCGGTVVIAYDPWPGATRVRQSSR